MTSGEVGAAGQLLGGAHRGGRPKGGPHGERVRDAQVDGERGRGAVSREARKARSGSSVGNTAGDSGALARWKVVFGGVKAREEGAFYGESGEVEWRLSGGTRWGTLWWVW